MGKGSWRHAAEPVGGAAIVREELRPERFSVPPLPPEVRGRDEVRRSLAELRTP